MGMAFLSGDADFANWFNQYGRDNFKLMKIIACNSNRPLAEAISAYVNLPLTKASVRRFSDMEIFVEIEENVQLSPILDTPARIESPVPERRFRLNWSLI